MRHATHCVVTLSCALFFGSAAVALAEPSNNVLCSIRAIPQTVVSGESVKLVWAATGARTAAIDGIGAVTVSGYRTVLPTKTQEYVMRVRGAGNLYATCKTRVTVTTRKPSCHITITPLAVASNSFATLSWNVQHADSASISGIGKVATNGTRMVRTDQTTKYTISARGAGGTCENSATLQIQDPYAAYGYFPQVARTITYPLTGRTSSPSTPTIQWPRYSNTNNQTEDAWVYEVYDDAYEYPEYEDGNEFDDAYDPYYDDWGYDDWDDPEYGSWYNESYYEQYYEPTYYEPNWYYQQYYEDFYDRSSEWLEV